MFYPEKTPGLRLSGGEVNSLTKEFPCEADPYSYRLKPTLLAYLIMMCYWLELIEYGSLTSVLTVARDGLLANDLPPCKSLDRPKDLPPLLA